MNQISHADLDRRLRKLEADVGDFRQRHASADEKLDTLSEAVMHIRVAVGNIEATLNQVQGGWKALLWIGGVAVTLVAVAAAAYSAFFSK